ncbi:MULTISPECIES: hypothetical protein [unclassified Maridesulfovibrio]|uniref:hypothetical protein n=1 Tax=unclassified Maridesulfovibrio TaxID=2794999 RepID=UPI003B3DEEAA
MSRCFISVLMSIIMVLAISFFACAEDLYISNLPDGSISVIDSNDHPNPISKRHIAGVDTLLTGPDVFGMFLYSNELFVTNDAKKTMLVFDVSVNGNVTPKRKITGLSMPRGVVVSGGELFVGDTVDRKGQISVFDLKAKDAVSPKRVIKCDFDDVKLGEVWTLAVSGSEIFVSDGDKIYVFDAASNLNTRPKRVIQHKSDAFGAAYGLDADSKNIYVSDSKNRIMVFPIASSGQVEPIATISGLETKLSSPYSLTVKNEYIYSSQYSGGKINVYKTTDNGEVEPQWSYTSADFPVAWMIAVEKNNYVRPSEHQQNGVNVSIISNAENATTDTVLQSAYRTPSNFELRAPVGSFTATVDSNGANGVFRFNSTSLSGTTNNVRLYKCYETNGTSIPFGSYSIAVDPDTEGTWWLEDDNGNYIDPGTSLTKGTNYWVNYVVKDNGIYDEDRTLGSIKDPAALGAVNGGGGCVMNPAAGFGLEWVFLVFATLIGLVGRRRN